MRTSIKTLLSLAIAASMAVAPAAFAGHDHYRGGWHHHDWHGGRWHGHGGYYRHHGHYDHFGRWVAGAVVAGALVSLIADATTPSTTVYYSDAPPPRRVVYREPTVVYERAPVVVEHRVYETRVYDDTPPTRYIRDDGWHRDDDDDGN